MTRPAENTDFSGIKAILETIELFPPEMLEEQMAPYLNDPQSGHHWFVQEKDGNIQGFCYSIPEMLTDETHNLLAIGVNAELQGQGAGKQLMAATEAALKQAGVRILIVDTSGADDFKLTRKFYTDLGYTKEAVIRDYWADGDDKVVFWKRLAA